MTTNIDIKALAKEIAKHYNASAIIKECESLIGECDPYIDEYIIIEQCVEDGFLGFDDWTFDIRITPDVVYTQMGGYTGCDWCDSDLVVDSIIGIDYVAVYGAFVNDAEGNEYELDDNQLADLKNELEDAIYEA